MALLVMAFLGILPNSARRLPEVQSFIPTINAFIVASELMTGALIYGQASVFRSRALVLLASGYIASALISVLYALSFPGAFVPSGLLGGGLNTTAWLAFFRLATFPVTVISYALLKGAEAEIPEIQRPAAPAWGSVLSAILLTAMAGVMTTWGHDLLPPLFIDRRQAFLPNFLVVNASIIGLTLLATVLLFRKRRSVLDLWLLVALSAWVAELSLNLTLHERYSLGWYSVHGIILASTMVVMLALISESNRLYARLALSTAEREHEREARLMTVRGMAAAIAHEVGQPLTGVNLSAKATLNWLTRDPPDTQQAIMSARETLQAGQRSFSVIKSLRATFGKEPGSRSPFNLNKLVRETAALFDKRMSTQNVVIEFTLDETLPLVIANRIQLQQVIVNLLTNALESLSTTASKSRRIGIRSATADAQHVLLEISDSGAGVPPEAAARIFEPFFTTKATGTGLGLSLSRTIVEEHGGRLWVSPNPDQGVTCHMQMPLGQ